MNGYIKDVKNVKLAAGFTEIMLPGEIEYRKEKESEKSGIAIDDPQYENLKKLLSEAGCPAE
jgi:LDH2 family malate/lactate/ureidoglycolate dehydrogenase